LAALSARRRERGGARIGEGAGGSIDRVQADRARRRGASEVEDGASPSFIITIIIDRQTPTLY
jgi:hypothetical protein